MNSDWNLKKMVCWARNHGIIPTKNRTAPNSCRKLPPALKHVLDAPVASELCQAHEVTSLGVLLEQFSGVWSPDLAGPWLLAEKEMAQGWFKSHRKECMVIDFPIPEVSYGRSNTMLKIKTREIILRCVNYIITLSPINTKYIIILFLVGH